MGRSADATLCFGIDLGERNPLIPADLYDEDGCFTGTDDQYEKGDTTLGERVLFHKGWSDPYDDYPSDCEDIRDYHERQAYLQENHSEWVDKKDEWYEALGNVEANIPVEIVKYGCEDYNCYILALKGTQQTAPEYGSTPIDIYDILNLTDDIDKVDVRIAAARVFCQQYDLVAFDNPKWMLCASYG